MTQDFPMLVRLQGAQVFHVAASMADNMLVLKCGLEVSVDKSVEEQTMDTVDLDRCSRCIKAQIIERQSRKERS